MRSAIAAGFCLATICFAGSAHAQNQPPVTPHEPYPIGGGTQQSIVTWVSWESGDEEGGLEFDVYWGKDPDPPLIAVNIPVNPYNLTSGYYQPPGIQQYSTTYYWRVVARDKWGTESFGPTWSYTTKALNEPPLIPIVRAPADGADGNPINVTLKYHVQDFEGGGCNVDLYFGTDPSPPLVAENQSGVGVYKPGLLTPSTLHYWRVVARDPQGLETSGPVWSFTTANTTNQLPDTPSNPRPAFLDEFDPLPLLQWDCTDPQGEELIFYIYFGTQYPSDNYPLPLWGTTTENMLPVGPLTDHTRYYWYVEVKDAEWTVEGPLWRFDNGTVPVLFTQFEARQAGDNVEVRWLLSSDEAMDSYTLFRSEGVTGSQAAIASAPVRGVEGSHVDASVEPSKTYHYELRVRTAEGDEYRSPIAAVATEALRLVLYQNVPNPFNPQTTIRYDLPSAAQVRLMIVDVAGRRVRTLVDDPQAAG